MARVPRWFFVLTGWLSVLALPSRAQLQPPAEVRSVAPGVDQTAPNPSVIPPTLQQLTRKAGSIFEGTVTSIRREESQAGGAGAMRVDFRVRRVLRGVRGRTFTVREWAGLWTAGPRYRVGERVLLFLYPPSKLGLTSPVGDGWGVFPVNHDGEVMLRPEWSDHAAGVPGEVRRRGKNKVSFREFARAVWRAAEE